MFSSLIYVRHKSTLTLKRLHFPVDRLQQGKENLYSFVAKKIRVIRAIRGSISFLIRTPEPETLYPILSLCAF